MDEMYRLHPTCQRCGRPLKNLTCAKNVARRFWGDVKEENTVADGLQYFKCAFGDGYVIDQNKLPGGKHNFMSFAGSYIIHSSDWRELAKLSPKFAYAIYQTQRAVKRLYKSFEDFRQAVLGK